MSEKDYNECLQIAEKKIARINKFKLQEESLPSSIVQTVFGRDYQTGDNWDVAAWQEDRTDMRMTGDENHLGQNTGHFGIFHYEVLQTNTDQKKENVIKIVQKNINYLRINIKSKTIDPRISSIQLTLNNSLSETERSYYFNGSNNKIRLDSGDSHSGFSPLEFLPLIPNELNTAERIEHPILPPLAHNSQEILEAFGLKPEFTKSIGFEGDDFFGRPIHVLWRHGDPWPTLIKSASGVAILIHKDKL